MVQAREARLTALLIAQDAFKDLQGRIHVYGIFDTLSAERFPVMLTFRVFCRVHGEGNHTVYVKIVDSLDDKLVETEAMPCEVSPIRGHDLFLTFGVALKAQGKYMVQAFLDGVLQLETPLMIRQAKPEDVEG
jgi:hypothetical protein